jgi:hypothetical protein
MRLAISFPGVQFHNFWTYGSKVMKVLGEVWTGQACIGANEEELTTCGKKCG